MTSTPQGSAGPTARTLFSAFPTLATAALIRYTSTRLVFLGPKTPSGVGERVALAQLRRHRKSGGSTRGQA